MTLQYWPTDLPQCFLTAGYGEAGENGLLVDGYDVGPPAYRRRSTAAPEPFAGEMFMTGEEWATLSTFFHTTLFDGVVRFLFPPQGVTDVARFWISRFVAPPARRASGNEDGWLVSLKLERLGIGEVFLTPALLSDPDTVYAPTIIWDQLLVVARHNNTNTIYAPRTPYQQFATASLYSNTNTFYAPNATWAYIAISFAEVEANT